MEKLADLKSGRPATVLGRSRAINQVVRTYYSSITVLYLVVPRFMLLVFRT